MKILGFTDFHGDRWALEMAVEKSEEVDPDLILVAGDLAFRGGSSGRALIRLGKSCGMLLFVPGNLDSRELIEFASGNVYSIHGRCINYMELDFLGLGGSPKGPFRTSFEYDEGYAEQILKRALEGCKGKRLIVVSHSPPLDSRLDVTAGGLHVGSRALRSFLEEVKPELVVCGHIHEGRGVDRIAGRSVVNPGSAYEGYYTYLEINGEVEIELKVF